MEERPRGTLILIGGHEDKRDDLTILKRVAEKAIEGKPLVLVTAASREQRELIRDYKPVFSELGVKEVTYLDIETREDCFDEPA